MKGKKLIWSSFALLISHFAPLNGECVSAHSYSEEMKEISTRLKSSTLLAQELFDKGAREGEYASLLEEIQNLRSEKETLRERWRSGVVERENDEEFASWDIGEIALSQLIMEYGGTDYVYVIPSELGAAKLVLFSTLTLPRESWSEMIEAILAQNGIGIKTLNSFAKQLYLLKADHTAVAGIVSKEEDLSLFAPTARLFFVFPTLSEQIKSIQTFFERFSDPKQTSIYAIGSKLMIVSTREVIEKLLGLHRAVWEQEQGKLVRLVPLTKITPTEAEKVLKAVFLESSQKGRSLLNMGGGEEIVTLVLPQGLVLVGEREVVERGEKILSEIQLQLDDPEEKVVYWYTCRHSDPESVAAVLERVYDSLLGLEGKEIHPAGGLNDVVASSLSNLPVQPKLMQPGRVDLKEKKSVFGSFIVDPKTTSILMVVRREDLPKIQQLLKKLDAPKKMVQIDVLLVEKKVRDRKQVGINLLKIGSLASGKKEMGAQFNTDYLAPQKGIFSFLLSRPGKFLPSIDLNYHFLMSQEDLRIHANPSVLAVNQTPATISILEEISINNGAVIDSNGKGTIEKSFTRAQFGITIVITPTIHLSEEDEAENGFISLQTDLTFDTTPSSLDDRPPVTRRHMENEVRIPNGQTVILGGLRCKGGEESHEKVPFLGDLPGIGKLFGSTRMSDTSTEMFIFITPRIIQNSNQSTLSQQELAKKRVGDIPEFLENLKEAKIKEQAVLFANSMNRLLN